MSRCAAVATAQTLGRLFSSPGRSGRAKSGGTGIMSRRVAVATPENARTAVPDRWPLGSRQERSLRERRSTSLIPRTASRFLDFAVGMAPTRRHAT